MPRVFAITTAADTVRLDTTGSGEAAFTITNSTSRPLRGRVRLKPQEGTDPKWLSVAGEPERDFAPSATEQVTVRATVPPGTKPGRYAFRLDVHSAANPDEDFAEGPVVALEVGPSPQPTSFPRWIVAVVALVLAVGGAGLWFFTRPKLVEVPKATGVPVEQARRLLEELGLGVQEQPEVAAAPAGQVVRQEPEAGRAVRQRSTVTLVVATAPPEIEVPNVVGLEVAAAEQLLRERGFQPTVGERRASRDFAANRVIRQVPEGSARARPNSAVTLTVAGESRTVPRIQGMKLQAAMKVLQDRGLTVAGVTGDPNKLTENVVGSTPGADAVVLVGSGVTIHMPGGRIVLPPHIMDEVIRRNNPDRRFILRPPR